MGEGVGLDTGKPGNRLAAQSGTGQSPGHQLVTLDEAMRQELGSWAGDVTGSLRMLDRFTNWPIRPQQI